MALAQEMHSKEMSMIDMLAELRSSLGRNMDSREERLAGLLRRESQSTRSVLGSLRRAVWILALAIFGGLALVALFS